MTEKVTISATIPVAQYGNLSPSFEVEADTHDEAMDIALKRIKDVWDRTATKSLEIRKVDAPRLIFGEELRCWASGTRVTFDAASHSYSTGDGKKWLSGSTFAGNYKSEFNAPLVAGKMATKYEVDASEVIDMWALNNTASQTVGSAVHYALQLRGQYGDLSRSVKDGTLESALTKNEILRPIVEAFFETREHETAVYEAFVADPVRAHCGFIDRLVIEDDGVWVEDYKTNADLDKAETIKVPFKGLVPNSKLGAYWLQLSFYARVLKSHGKTVKGLRIHHWVDGAWKTYEREVIDLDAAFKKGD
ncbi:PD-(D/E)XK nuclease family protein [Mycobacteroides chelonae]|nr:PD-(D/E)XK nuclease family protein [Mycobacteroides chelonae]